MSTTQLSTAPLSPPLYSVGRVDYSCLPATKSLELLLCLFFPPPIPPPFPGIILKVPCLQLSQLKMMMMVLFFYLVWLYFSLIMASQGQNEYGMK
jgi:uncharacterized RDD family membrane protein YckC